MNKTWGKRKIFIIKKKAAGRESSYTAPSQPLFNPLFWGEIALWLWPQGSWQTQTQKGDPMKVFLEIK
jgi:hypothetical protein